MPIQQMLLGVGAVAKKTYVDDVFSNYLYTGTGSARSINTGIDMTEGGLVWIKNRDQGYNHSLQDTVRGAGKDKRLASNLSTAQDGTDLDNYWAGYISSFNNNGFSVDKEGSGAIDWANYNKSGDDYTAWNFRKAPGFFDVVTWDGDNNNPRQIAHNLGCVPGLIMIKAIENAYGMSNQHWNVYHTSLTNSHYLRLNEDHAKVSSSNFPAQPTATHFTVGYNYPINYTGAKYIAYLFAGGESTAATARSVDFDGSDDYLEISSHADLQLGTGDFTLEMWWNGSPSGSYTQCFGTQSLFDASDGTWRIGTRFGSADRVYFARGNGSGFDEFYYDVNVNDGSWHHIACVRASNIVTIYIDGVAQGTPDWRSGTVPENRTVSGTCSSNEDFWVGRQGRPSNVWAEGKMSNIRVVKGTAVYTSSFRPSTEPLTNITNTVLLICNNSSVTGSTVTPGTISSGGSPTASTDSPFDDPAGFVFGENEDQGIIKCGSYVGNGSSTGPEIYLGFEPSWILLKNATASSRDWKIVDAMRGIVTGGNDASLRPNESDDEDDESVIDLTPTGFKITASNAHYNENGETIVYCAIRRPDGYVGKPPSLGTDVFAMDTGNSSTTIPVFDSNFPVDFAIAKQFAATTNWFVYGRLIQKKYLITNSTASAATSNGALFDSNVGYSNQSTFDSGVLSWMWKRHSGFDVIFHEGDGVSGRQISHSLSKTPEMMWVKAISGSYSHQRDWRVFHNGLNGGSNSEQYGIKLNSTDAESQNSGYWNDTAPTSTHFTVGNSNNVNDSGLTYMTMLFASVDGISKVGYYTGNGSTQTISTGFAPRFVIIRRTDGTEDNWVVLDTTRGWASGDDKVLKLNENHQQGTSDDFGAPTSSGFSLTSDGWVNYDTGKFIYYAHA